jgi:response regulator NasT
MNSPKNRSLRIAVADDERDMRLFFQELLPRLGHTVLVVADTGRKLVDACRAAPPELVITDIKMPDMDGLEAINIINRDRQVPVILVTAHHEVDFLPGAAEGHIMAYLTKPVKPVDLQAAITLAIMRFEHFQQLSKETATLRQALEDRKVIERAKGAMMRRLRIEEDEAFVRLRRLASDTNHKLVEVAQSVLAAEEVFHTLER